MKQNLLPLFEGWDAPMLRACLQGRMGRVIPWGENSALASIGDFCFLAGAPVPELVERTDAPLLIPCGEGWAEQIEAVLGEEAAPFTRYAVRQDRDGFDLRKLFNFTESVPEGISIVPIDREIYFTLVEQEWSRDLCGCFSSAEDFLAEGLGFAAIQRGGLLVAGASSYAACGGAIEIEIDTRPDFRRQGLAAACGAKLILECRKRGLYPGWDAHDSRSLALAEKLGYRLERPYRAYWVEKQVRG